MNEEILLRPASELAALLAERSLRSVDLVAGYLERIEHLNPRLNALVQVDAERALAAAGAADADLKHGRRRGPLHGVPCTVKDVFDTEGIVTSVGLEQRRGYVPASDAAVVGALKRAGAIVLGKSNLPPGGAGGDSDNSVYGRTNNPWDEGHTVGGSSGGECAAQAAGFSAFGIGSDSGGSLRLPAHYNGVCTIKPTSGRVPNTGAFEHAGGFTDTRTQIGPITRHVADLYPILRTIAFFDWADAGVTEMPLRAPDRVDLLGLRVAWYAGDGDTPVTAETDAAVRAAAGALSEAGLQVQESLPPVRDALEITQRYWQMETLPHGRDVVTLLADWDAFRTRMLQYMQAFDLIVCPVDWHPAPPHGEPDPNRFNYTLPYSLTGWPSAVVPAGRSGEGMPIGVQIVARPWREDVALAAARAIERALGGYSPPPVA